MIIKITNTSADSLLKDSSLTKKKRKRLQLLEDLIMVHPSSVERLAQMSGISSPNAIFKILDCKCNEVNDPDLKKISDFLGLEGETFKSNHIFYFFDGKYRPKIKELIPLIFKNGAFYVKSHGMVCMSNGSSTIIVNAKNDFVEDVLSPITNILHGLINPHFALEGRPTQKEINLLFKGNDFERLATWDDAKKLAENARVDLKEVLAFIRRSDVSTQDRDCEKSRQAVLAIQDMTQVRLALKQSSPS